MSQPDVLPEAAPATDLFGETVLDVRDLTKSYPLPKGETKFAIDGLTFAVRRGEFVSIVGPSGAGKTTLLRCISGLLQPTSGEVLMDGEAVTGPPPALGMVFQEYGRSLLPWFTNEKNVALPLLNRGVSRKEARGRAQEAMASVSLDEVARKQYPWQLSGGMQQRIAIARAIAYESELLVMDEPFASVDAQTRLELEDLILQLQRDWKMTVLFVTHDIDEAVYLSDRIVVLTRTPATVREIVTPELDKPRNQLTTKADPEFAATRAHVLSLVMPQTSP